MANFQSRCMKIINTDNDDARAKYNIQSVDQLIDEHCTKTLSRMLADPTHPLLRIIPKAGVRAKFRFQPAIPKTTAYGQSFVQKHLRACRDGVINLYSSKVKIGQITSTKLSKPTTKCAAYGRNFINVKLHIKRSHSEPVI